MVHATSEMRLAGICSECMKRLGVDERMTIPINFVQVSQLPEYDERSMAGIQFPGTSRTGSNQTHHQGTTKITYKIAKTVKETIDDAASHTSQPSHKGSSGL